jgi:hypothetical protein
MGIGTSSSSGGGVKPPARNAYAVNRDASELRRSPGKQAANSAQPGPMHVIYMSVPTGIQAAHPADSHGHRPQNHPTCANQQTELCAPKRIQPGRTYAEARQKDHSPAAAITPYRHGAGTIRRHPIPAHRKQMAHSRHRPSQHDSDLPAELVTPIDLPCTPEVPSIHLPWTCAATGRGPSATTPTHPILHE